MLARDCLMWLGVMRVLECFQFSHLHEHLCQGGLHVCSEMSWLIGKKQAVVERTKGPGQKQHLRASPISKTLEVIERWVHRASDLTP